MPDTTTTAPVRVSIEVTASQETAFKVFTERMNTWWPLATHSLEGEDVMSAEMECRIGGRVVERHKDGTEANWGTIDVWDPPNSVGFSWNPSYEERPETHVEVRFTSLESGGTRVDLEHRGWEVLGERAAEMRAGYDEGWTYILTECYAKAAI